MSQHPIQALALDQQQSCAMQKVTKANRLIDGLVAHNTLTPEGRDWLKLALDPFHDLDKSVAGYPDADTSMTVVSCYQGAVDVAKPVSVTTSTWDAHIFTLPLASLGAGVNFDEAALDPAGNHYTVPVAYGTTARDLINIEINNTGSPLYPTTSLQVLSATRTSTHYTPSATAFESGSSRIIGMALEVVDTSAEINKQGAVTVYRMPQMPSTGQYFWTDTAAVANSTRDEVTMRSPPSTVADALKLVGSRQWEAPKGCYALCTQSTVANPLMTPVPKPVSIVPGPGHGVDAETDHMTILGGALVSPATVSRKTVFPLNTTGIMMTGLHANGTFRLKYKVYVEFAPQPWQPDLATLATPSAPYDPIALEAYSKVLAQLPVGVEASQNGFGDWFRGLADIVSTIALPVSAALTPFFPAAPIVGAAAYGVSKAIKAVVPADKPRRPPTTNAAQRGQKADDGLYPKTKVPSNSSSMAVAYRPTRRGKSVF